MGSEGKRCRSKADSFLYLLPLARNAGPASRALQPANARNRIGVLFQTRPLDSSYVAMTVRPLFHWPAPPLDATKPAATKRFPGACGPPCRHWLVPCVAAAVFVENAKLSPG